MGIDDYAIIAAINYVSAGILGLAFILLIVFCVLASKTWNWINIVFLILTFMAGVGAIFGLTTVSSLRTDAINEADRYEDLAETTKKRAEEQIKGDPTSATYGPGSLRYIDGVLSREMIGRGRVWPNGQIVADGDKRTFTFSTARPADFEPLQDVVLLAFLELDVKGQLYPAGFIGSVRVVAEAPGTLTLEPVALADFQQFVTPTGTWRLFEKMPLDRRGTFKRAIIAAAKTNPDASERLKTFARSLEDENVELDITTFRDYLKGFLQPQNLGIDPESIEYEALIDRYAFDGLPIGTIEQWIDNNSASRKSPRFQPGPEEVFVKYEFTAPSRQEGYQVDAIGSVENDGLFNPLGHAIDQELHHGGVVTFEKGDTVLVDQVSAEGYQRSGTQVPAFEIGESVKVVDRIYIRQVRDYPFEFGNLTLQSAKADEEIQRVSQSNVVQQKLIDDANAQIQERLRIINDQTEDRTNLQNDLDTINALATQKTQQVSTLKQTIASLETKIEALYTELRTASIALSRKAFAGK
jgi:hypothetical protein